MLSPGKRSWSTSNASHRSEKPGRVTGNEVFSTAQDGNKEALEPENRTVGIREEVDGVGKKRGIAKMICKQCGRAWWRKMGARHGEKKRT